MIPPKLVKIAASESIFPDNAKIAKVLSLKKGTSNKNGISNFQSISILTMFSKTYERVTKKLIVKAMNKYLSLFISAYQQNYSTQHVFICLLEEWRDGLDNNFVVGGVFMDLSKVFICIPHDLLIAKQS